MNRHELLDALRKLEQDIAKSIPVMDRTHISGQEAKHYALECVRVATLHANTPNINQIGGFVGVALGMLFPFGITVPLEPPLSSLCPNILPYPQAIRSAIDDGMRQLAAE